MARIAISFSAGIRAIRHIEVFLAVDRVVAPAGWNKAEDDACVVVWGRKRTTRLARAFAQKHSLPVLQLEDGFIRTCSEDAHSRMTYSLVVDRKGIYYDADTGSELEDLLLSSTALAEAYSDIEEELTQACLEIVVDFNVTKYNFSQDCEPNLFADGRKTVLVIDQTHGDASIVHGGMDKLRFEQMLDAAIEENPAARIVVKTHPDVISGDKTGYLTQYARQLGVELYAEPVNSLSLLKQVNRVYVGTSQMGMEALLCGKDVSVFGRPFYAGWGLTDDRMPLEQERPQRTLRELFFAAYIWYPRYCHPVTGQLWTLPECLEHVLRQKQHFAENAKRFYCVGITPWKKRYISAYLRSPAGRIEFGSARQFNARVSTNSQNCDAVVTWGYRAENLPEGLGENGTPNLYRLEDGFIRSSGLGSDFNAPGSLVMDSLGLYFNAKSASDLEYLLNHGQCNDDQRWRARHLIDLIKSAKLSKYNVGDTTDEFSSPQQSSVKILVVGQVESDASLAFGAEKIKTNALLVQAVRRLNPDAWIAYKPHPDVAAGNRKGKVSDDILNRTVDRVIGDTDIISCIEAVDELHTMTSLAGFEALLRGKTVKTYGTPFYAGWGLTTDLVKTPRREARRTLEELVYYTLIVYPRYMDVETGEFISPEDMVATTRSHSMKNKNMNWTERQVTKVINVCKGLGYAP
ncbi:MAG: capsular polysaccharide biosynthesis protein [Gammaproteobacteria bacterium]|nr:capsular polysaccharide biosynthesis protein [Gammaproteobacteria bacterium]